MGEGRGSQGEAEKGAVSRDDYDRSVLAGYRITLLRGDVKLHESLVMEGASFEWKVGPNGPINGLTGYKAEPVWKAEKKV